ncbi:MAG: sulfite exporter TauE/SafE family protein [Saprospiraceae bacterium]
MYLFIDHSPLFYVLLLIVSFGASLLTFYSGFGLGTLLLPVFAIWFPLDQAILLTAIVHFFNNIFKLYLFRKNIDIFILFRFGIPAILGALLGSFAMVLVNNLPIRYPVKIGPFNSSLTVFNLVIGILIIVFGILEFTGFGKKNWGNKSMTLGGLLSGFFGGLSGHQGVLRSAFLIRYNFTKEAFFSTGVAIACLVDITRLAVYIPEMLQGSLNISVWWLLLAILSASAGVLVGNKMLKKMDIEKIKKLTAVCIVLMGMAILLGIV